jgi:hypothetical protein
MSDEQPFFAVVLNHLATYLHAEGRAEEAEEHYKRSLALAERLYGSDSKIYAMGLSRLAQLLSSVGRHSEAEPLRLQARAATAARKKKTKPTLIRS